MPESEMTIDFYRYVVGKIRALPAPSASARGALYRALLQSLDVYIERYRQKGDPRDLRHLSYELNETMNLIEREFNKAIHVHERRMPYWVSTDEPRTIANAHADLESAEERASPQEQPHPAQPSQSEFASQTGPTQGSNWEFPVLMAVIDDGERILQSSNVNLSILTLGPPKLTTSEIVDIVRMRARIIGALLRRYIHTTAGTERLGYFWTLLEPMMQIILVVSIYYILGHPTIFGMPAIPFAVIGVSSWLMLRMIIFRLGHGLGREAMLCNFPCVRPLDIKIAKSIFYGLTYFGVMIAALLLDKIFSETSYQIRDFPLFLGYWGLLCIFSLGLGLIFAKIFHAYPWIVRVSLFLLRGIYLVSGALFVSEQLPTEIRQWIIWIPTVHGIQLMRSAFFYEYSSTDASTTYFIISMFLILTFGLLCERTLYREGISA